MARKIRTASGVTIVLRNPAEKAKRYARQMKNGIVTETGKKLRAVDMAYRAGYLDARTDNAKCFNAQGNAGVKTRTNVKKK